MCTFSRKGKCEADLAELQLKLPLEQHTVFFSYCLLHIVNVGHAFHVTALVVFLLYVLMSLSRLQTSDLFLFIFSCRDKETVNFEEIYIFPNDLDVGS